MSHFQSNENNKVAMTKAMTDEEQIEKRKNVPLPVSQLPDIVAFVETAIEIMDEDPDPDEWRRGYLAAMEDVMVHLRLLPKYIRSKLLN